MEYWRSKMRGQIGHLCLILPSFCGKITLIRLPDLSGEEDRALFEPLLLWITPLGGAMFSCSFKCFWSSSELENPRLHSKHGQELISSSRARKKIYKNKSRLEVSAHLSIVYNQLFPRNFKGLVARPPVKNRIQILGNFYSPLTKPIHS